MARIRSVLKAVFDYFRPHNEPHYDPAKDPEFVEVIRRQNQVIERLQHKGVATDAFGSLLQESWASPEDYRKWE